jgi:hypothetical protein
VDLYPWSWNQGVQGRLSTTAGAAVARAAVFLIAFVGAATFLAMGACGALADGGVSLVDQAVENQTTKFRIIVGAGVFIGLIYAIRSIFHAGQQAGR